METGAHLTCFRNRKEVHVAQAQKARGSGTSIQRSHGGDKPLEELEVLL